MVLQLYVLRQLLISIAFAVAGISMVVFPTIAVQSVVKLQGVSPVTVLRYLPYVAVEFVPYLFPLAFLLGVVSTFGRIAADRELVAVRMAGIHPGRLLLPGFVVAAVLSLATYEVLANVSPKWKFIQRAYLVQARETAFRSIGRGTTEVELDEFYFKAERQDAGDDRLFHGVTMNLPGEDGELTVVADRVRLSFDEKNLVLDFHGFQALEGNVEVYNENPRLTLPLSELFPTRKRNRERATHLATPEIAERIAEGGLEEKKEREFRYEVHRRRALAATYFFFLLLGLPTGVLLRSGTQLGAFTGAVGYAFLYYILDMRLGEQLAQWGSLPVFLGAWSTNLVFLVAGLVLTYRALWK